MLPAARCTPQRRQRSAWQHDSSNQGRSGQSRRHARHLGCANDVIQQRPLDEQPRVKNIHDHRHYSLPTPLPQSKYLYPKKQKSGIDRTTRAVAHEAQSCKVNRRRARRRVARAECPQREGPRSNVQMSIQRPTPLVSGVSGYLKTRPRYLM